MKNPLVLLLLLTIPCVSVASTGCDRLLFGGWSHHTDTSYEYNESHNMIGIQCNSISAMHFSNSYGEESYGIGYDWVGYKAGPIELGAYAGLWSGYEGYDYGRPVAGVRGKFNVGKFSIVLTSVVKISTIHLEFRL